MSATGTIFDLKRYAIHDGPGIRTTVFFKGCPLDCWWCQNPESRSSEPERRHLRSRGGNPQAGEGGAPAVIGCSVSTEDLTREIMKDEIFYDQSAGGVTVSGGEPMLQSDFLYELLRACKRRGLHTAVDTSGVADRADCKRVAEVTDLFLYDLKVMDEEAHVRFTGASNSAVRENFVFLAEAGASLTVRVPLVPGITDTRANLEAIAAFLEPFAHVRRIDILPYNRLGEDKAERFGFPAPRGAWSPQTPESLAHMRAWLEQHGFQVGIGG